MSAFLMGPDELAAIASAFVAFVAPNTNPETVFDDLLNENLASVGYRYPDAQRISDWFDDGEALFVWAKIPMQFRTATELDEMTRSYQYQSCEHPAWQTCRAKIATDALRVALAPMVKDEANAEAAKVAARRHAIAQFPSLSAKETAAAIRKLLKANYPATKFSVVTERGSMVSSVRISWTDGPTTKLVDALTACFEAGKFDGMTDSYEYDYDHLIEFNGQKFRPGCRYVFTQRTISADLANRCIAQLTSYWGGIENPPVAETSKWGGNFTLGERGHESIRPDLPAYSHDWYTMIHQAANDAQQFVRAFRD